jgi:hypothetical protein
MDLQFLKIDLQTLYPIIFRNPLLEINSKNQFLKNYNGSNLQKKL